MMLDMYFGMILICFRYDVGMFGEGFDVLGLLVGNVLGDVLAMLWYVSGGRLIAFPRRLKTFQNAHFLIFAHSKWSQGFRIRA